MREFKLSTPSFWRPLTRQSFVKEIGSFANERAGQTIPASKTWWCGVGTKPKSAILIAASLSDNRFRRAFKFRGKSVAGKTWRLQDLFSDAVYERDGAEMLSSGLYLELDAWGFNLFRFESAWLALKSCQWRNANSRHARRKNQRPSAQDAKGRFKVELS